MSDLDCIAHQARRTLATTTGGVLHVEGVGPTTCDGILPYEHDGRPRFLCEPAEPLAAIARTTPQAVLEAAAPCRHSLRTIVLSGELSVIGSAPADDRQVDVVELAVRIVHLEVSRGRGVTGSRVEVPLDRYLTASPDPVIDAARRVMAHLNDTHADRLRRSAASRSGQSIDRILAAQVRDADDYGLALNWLDESGGHIVRLRFGRPVRSPVDLIAKLHELLADQDTAPGAP
jgi:hypothetical protein